MREALLHPPFPSSHSPRLRRARSAVALGKTPGCYPLTQPTMGPSSSCSGRGGSGISTKVIYNHMGKALSQHSALLFVWSPTAQTPAVFPAFLT